MKITGLEVIRDNPAINTDVLPGEVVELTYGNKLRVNTKFDYRGPAGTVTLYGAIGVRGATFTEKVHGESTITLPQSVNTFTTVLASVDIGITSAIEPGTNYDVYCKLLGHLDAGLPEVDNVINITGIPPTFTLIQHTIYPAYYMYDGDVEVSTFSARISPFAPSNWASERFAAEMKSQVEAKSGKVIEMKIYVDITPLLWTDIKVELTTTPIVSTATRTGHMTTGQEPISGAAIAAIIITVLVIIGIIVLTWSVLSIVRAFKHQGLSEAIKKTWSRATLISTIGDFEKYLNRTPTPISDLEAMSDQQLRDYCDELANVIAPPGMNWLPWVIGGVLVTGAGIIAVTAMSKKK